MKKVWQVIFVFFVLIGSTKVAFSDPDADVWVDSVFQKLTVDEQIGQLIDLKIAPSFENLDDLYSIITKYHIGSITLTGGNSAATIKLINTLQQALKVPVYITAENENGLGLPFKTSELIPLPGTFLEANDLNLFSSTVCELSNSFHELGVNGISFNPNELHYTDAGLDYSLNYNRGQNTVFDGFTAQYVQNNLIVNTDFYFNFSDDFGFSPKLLDAMNANLWHQKIDPIASKWETSNFTQSIITIKSLPDFPENEAIFFNKKIIDPLFWKHLEFEGILSSDLDAITAGQTNRNNESTIRMLLKIGSDKICISSNADKTFIALMDGLNSRYFKQNEIKGKVKRILELKYLAGLNHSIQIDTTNLEFEKENPELNKLSYQVFSRAIKVSESGEKVMPFVHLETTNFASLSLGFSEIKVFQETLDKYAPFVHYMLPGMAYDPFDLKILTEQLVQFDHVIIGLHTSGFVELDGTVLSFLKQLNEHTNVILVFLGNAIEPAEFEFFPNKIYAHEDNLMCQQIAAQYVFGAGNGTNSIRRLSYSMPEMQEMDSKTLKKIDEIVNEAITKNATPGCQILVARNGSIVLEKGYGYYTYDSIMPVDTRTIYDLASITKVAATTQAIMKLVENDKIQLEDTLGKYLPELAGSNKGSLVIREVLAHQSGLRAFYPFWKNTIEDDNHVLHYYSDIPNETHSNEVAYGMFATEDLKDSLWQWTVETKLRKKRYSYKPYDYKYSDLGFYLLQVLVERVSDTGLDAYVDSAFYKPMGMSTLTFNPLCKFPLMRIAPTERDTEFRHVLVWGTVHDQIAAMKGGVSGHAGLFGNANDIAKIMQMQLQDGFYGGIHYLEKETIANFTSRQFKNNRRGLGWDKPDKENDSSSTSRYASHDTFGHSGFTGTIVWVDPTFNLVFVFLSNRIYPSISNTKLIDLEIRKRIHDVVYESIWNYEKQYN